MALGIIQRVTVDHIGIYSVGGRAKLPTLPYVTLVFRPRDWSEAESKDKQGACDPMLELTITSIYPLQSPLQHIYHGQPYARVDHNPMPESTLSPSQGLWIWPLKNALPRGEQPPTDEKVKTGANLAKVTNFLNAHYF